MTNKERNEKIFYLINSAIERKEISKIFGLTKQRIEQILTGRKPMPAQLKWNINIVRDGEICWFCKNKFSWRELRVHHINLDPSDNKEKNLLTLCKNCHNQYHRLEKVRKNG